MKSQFPVVVLGAGKVGTALARALREAQWPVTLLAVRSGELPQLRRGLLLLAVKDGAIAPLAQRLAADASLGKQVAVAHLSGALGPSELSALRRRGHAVAQAHPCLSFTDPLAPPDLRGGSWMLTGDEAARRRLRRVAQALGLVPLEPPRLQRGRYHAAAALASNGSVALVEAAVQLLLKAGLPRAGALELLLPLLASTLENLRREGLPGALSGPVRRGAVATVQRHREVLAALPELDALYAALLPFQLTLARQLGEAQPADLAALARLGAERS